MQFLTRFVATVCLMPVITGFVTCTRIDQQNVAPVLLLSSTGTSQGDVAAIKDIMDSMSIRYAIVDADRLNSMSEEQMRKYRLFIIPGGDFIGIGQSLSPVTLSRIRNAVHSGLNYFGICAGGFLAGVLGKYHSLNLTSNVQFSFYAAEKEGVRKTAVAITFPEGITLDQYWEDGPQFSGWGAIVGKYPDGTPAIVQGSFGKGRVLLTGVHPEAPEKWMQGMQFHTIAAINNHYAAILIKAAVNGTMLPHY